MGIGEFPMVLLSLFCCSGEASNALRGFHRREREAAVAHIIHSLAGILEPPHV